MNSEGRGVPTLRGLPTALVGARPHRLQVLPLQGRRQWYLRYEIFQTEEGRKAVLHDQRSSTHPHVVSWQCSGADLPPLIGDPIRLQTNPLAICRLNTKLVVPPQNHSSADCIGPTSFTIPTDRRLNRSGPVGGMPEASLGTTLDFTYRYFGNRLDSTRRTSEIRSTASAIAGE